MLLKAFVRGLEFRLRITSFRKSRSETSLRFRTDIENGECIMRYHDFVSDGFLALTAAGLVLLCSSLLAMAFS